jgi:hypothetical protein
MNPYQWMKKLIQEPQPGWLPGEAWGQWKPYSGMQAGEITTLPATSPYPGKRVSTDFDFHQRARNPQARQPLTSEDFIRATANVPRLTDREYFARNFHPGPSPATRPLPPAGPLNQQAPTPRPF